MERRNGVSRKTVKLPKTPTMYKFIADGDWVVDSTFPVADDGRGVMNNILLPRDFHKVSKKNPSQVCESSM